MDRRERGQARGGVAVRSVRDCLARRGDDGDDEEARARVGVNGRWSRDRKRFGSSDSSVIFEVLSYQRHPRPLFCVLLTSRVHHVEKIMRLDHSFSTS